MKFAIHHERHRGSTAVENALMLKHPDLFRSRGFLSSYLGGRRGAKNPDPKAMKAIADFLHVNFEWLVLGTGPLRKGGRGETPAEEALFVARDWGIREDAWEIAWTRNMDRVDTMTAKDWFDAICSEAVRLDREHVPRPESIVAQKDAQARVRRASAKVARVRTKADAPASTPALDSELELARRAK